MATIDKLSQPQPYDFTQSRESDPGFVAPRPNFGPAHAFQQGVSDGYDTNLTSMSVRALKYWGLKRGAELAAGRDGVGVHNQFIDKVTFDKDYSLGGKLTFDAHYDGKMSLDYARSLQNDALDDELNRGKSGLSYAPIASFAGNMAGGLASPLDLAAAVVTPELMVAKWGMGATAASRSGMGFARAASRTANGAVNGLANAIAFQAPMYALSKENQTEYTLEDALNNIALGPIIGAGAGALHATATHLRGEADRTLANAAMHAAMSDGDPSVVSRIVQNDPRAQQATGVRERVRRLFTEEKRTPEQQAEIKFMAGDPLPENMTDARASRTGPRAAKIIDEVLANPEDRRIGLARTDDERFLADAWQKLFGVDLKFIDPGFARDLGVLGFTKPQNPGVAYISRGELSGKPSSMMFVAAHELGHQIRFRDTALWSDMTGAMMKTAELKNGPLAEAWRTYVRHANDTGVHAGQDLASKMDETFSHVLGHAMQQQEFWHAMSGSKGASKLAAALSGVHRRLTDLLNHRMTPATKALYEDLSMSLVKAKEAGITLDPAGADSNLSNLYAPHQPRFRQLIRNMAAEMNAEGTAREKDLAAHIAWEEATFPQVSSFTDESTSRFTTILKNRRIDSGNPGSWLLQNIFARAKPGTPERNAATMFAEGVRSSGKNPQSFALDKGPLATFKQNADGTWDIGIHRNDNYPHWSEIMPDNLPDRDIVADTALREHINTLEAEFAKFVEETQGKDTDVGHEFGDYLGALTDDEIAYAVYNEPTAFWNGYSEDLDIRLSELIVSGDEAAYNRLKDHREAIQPLTGAGDGKFDPKHTSPESVAKAWEKFRKDYPDIQKKLAERKLEMTGNVQGPLAHDITAVPAREFFETEFKAARAEVLAQLMEREESRLAIENFLKGADEKPTKLSDKINAALDEAARDRLRSVWPQYDRVMQIESALKANKAGELVLDMRDPSKLPAEVAGAMERFNTSLSDGLDALDFNFMAAEPQTPDQAVARKRISGEDAAKLARTRLDREHTELAKYLTSYGTAIEPRMKELLERSGMESFSLDPLPKPAAGATPVEKPTGPLADALDAVKNTYTAGMKQLGNLQAGRLVETMKYAGENVQSLFDYHVRQGLDKDGAVKAVAEDLRREAQARVVQTLRNDEARKSLLNRSRTSLDTLYSFLDGNARKGVQSAGASVAESMGGRIVSDTTPFAGELVRSGLDHVWADNTHPQHVTLVRSLIDELRNGGGKDPVIKGLAETLRKTHEVQVGRMNANGANIRPLPGYVFSQVHNPYAIGRNKAEFMTDLMNWLDWDATTKATGMFDKESYLAGAWEYLHKSTKDLPENFNPETMGGNIANQESHRRTFHFKDTAAFDYDMKYGSGNTAGLISEQLVKRAELATIMENFGADYKKVWAGVMQELGRAGTWRFGKLGRLDMTFQHLVGDLNHPENVRLAEMGAAARNYMNSVALWMSGVSSITDLGNATATMRWMGVTPTDLHARLLDSMKEQVGNGPADRQFLLAQGAGLQALLTAFSRTQIMGGPAMKFAQKASDFTFKYNGQELWTKTLQSAFHDLTSQHLGEMSKLKKLPEEFTNWLNHYGITETEWKTMAKEAADIDGLQGTRLAPDLVTDSALAAKLRMAIGDSAHQAILEPSVSDRALLTGGTKAGTPFGEAVRMAMQYKPYPLAMIRRVQRRFANAYGNEGLYAFGSNAQVHWLVWAGSMISLSATVLSIKDLLRGREPFNPFDQEQWNIHNATRIVAGAGVGPFAVAEQFLSARQIAGPGPGAVGALAAGVVSGDGYKTANAVMGLAPGASIIPIREGAKAVLGGIFMESYGVNYQLFLQRNAAETGQSSVFQK